MECEDATAKMSEPLNIKVEPDDGNEDSSTNFPDQPFQIKTEPADTQQENEQLTSNNKELTEMLPGPADHSHVCDHCGESFAEQLSLGFHLLTCPERSNSFSCTYCDKTYTSRHDLTIHSHEHAYSFCDICNMIFASKSDLNTHMRVHKNEKPNHQCTYCKKSFSSNGQLTRHSIVHTGKRCFPCSYCKRAFFTKGTLDVHLRTHKECTVCGKFFVGKTQFAAHKRLHDLDKRCQCTYCHKSFADRNFLTKHMLTHAGDQDYHCAYCDKRFSSRNLIRNHMLEHTEDKSNSSDLVEVKDVSNQPEQKQDRDSIEIYNFPVFKDENVLSLVQSFGGKFDLPCQKETILSAYRMNATEASPIIVKFRDEAIARQWLSKKTTKVRYSDLYGGTNNNYLIISERFSQNNQSLLWNARLTGQKLNFKFVWEKNGHVFMRENENAPVLKIRRLKDLPQVN